jgi:hypothetical protein
MSETRAVHKDDGKPQLSLIDPLFLNEVGKALTIPTVSGKYAPHNWRNGIEVSRLLNSTMRHINEFNDGVDNDVESGVSHLAHAACNLMFALRMLKDRPDLDDRYRAVAVVQSAPLARVVEVVGLDETDDEEAWRKYR